MTNSELSNSSLIKLSQKIVAVEVSKKISYSSRRTRFEKAYYFSIYIIVFLIRKLDILLSLATTLYKLLSYKDILKYLDIEK